VRCAAVRSPVSVLAVTSLGTWAETWIQQSSTL